MRGRGAIGRQRRRLTPMLCLFAERVDEVYGWTRTQDPSIVPMPLDKAIASGKEQRKPYRGSKAFDRSCRNHRGCNWCERNRAHRKERRAPADLTEQERTVYDVRFADEES